MRKSWKEILIIAWPLIIANSFWNLQLTIDRIFLGKFSTEGLAAAIAVSGVFWAPMALVQQTASYVTTFVAQLFGAKREKEIGASVWQAIYVSLVGGGLFMVLIPFAPMLFEIIGHSATLQPIEVEYFQAMCYSALPTALVAAASGFFIGLGRSFVTMWINLIGMFANVAFSYVLVFGKFGFPVLGVRGAGYGTALGTWVAALFAFYLVFRVENEKQYGTLSSWKFRRDQMVQFLKFGVPSGLQWAFEGLAFTVFLVFVGRMQGGDAALAASGIAVTAMMLAILPGLGMAQAVSVLVAQSLGENDPAKAVRSTWSGFQVAFMYIATIGASFWVFPGFYLSWFQNNDNVAVWNEVKAVATYLLMFVGTFTLFDCSNLVFSFALKGAGDTRFVSAVALFLPWPLMVLPTYLMKDLKGAVYLAWGAATIYSVTQAVVFWRRFEGGKWKSMRVV